MLPILEGGRRVCPWSSGLHKLWQHLVYLEVESLNLRLTLAPLPLPQLFNKHTTSILSGKLVAFYLVLTFSYKITHFLYQNFYYSIHSRADDILSFFSAM